MRSRWPSKGEQSSQISSSGSKSLGGEEKLALPSLSGDLDGLSRL
jgi:hypothetical protein